MSSSAYASVFKTLGGAFNTKRHCSVGGSGSENNVKDAAESAAPQVTVPDPIDRVENVVGVAGPSDGRVTKKRKQPGVKPPKAKTVVPDKVVCDEEFKSSDGRPVRIGNFTLEKLANTMSEIPSDQDWTDMEGAGLTAVLRRMTGHWGHLGGLISGAAQLSVNDVRAAQAEKKGAEDRANSLDKELRDLKSSIAEKETGFKTKLDAASVRADNAEKDAADLRKEVESLKKKLEDQDKDAIIAEFKRSKEYDEALATAGALEIFRCWVIAEKHIKTDPLADWDSFVKEFLAAKKDIEDGEGEPEPFDGPSPSFIPAAARINPDQD